MTDLQASLMVIGGTIVAGVISYNKWQEYKARKSVQKAFASEHDDVLMKSPPTVEPESSTEEARRVEPSFVADEQIGAAAGNASGAFQEPQESREPIVKAPAPQKELPVDELIDCAIALMPAAAVRGEKILPRLLTLRHVGNKPVHFIGQREDGSWEPVAHGHMYHGLFAGVQLANRTGALNELEYSELIMRLRQMCDEIDAEPDVPDMAEVIASARALHQFVAEHDAQLSVNVQSKGAPWALATLLAALSRQGFDQRPDGRLVMPDGDGGVLFSLSTNATPAAETTARLTLLLDVPRVPPPRDGFGAMIACAKVLSARLDGVVVDDSGQLLADAALAEIGEQVAAFYRHMEAANIPAGSTRALRLFS